MWSLVRMIMYMIRVLKTYWYSSLKNVRSISHLLMSRIVNPLLQQTNTKSICSMSSCNSWVRIRRSISNCTLIYCWMLLLKLSINLISNNKVLCFLKCWCILVFLEIIYLMLFICNCLTNKWHCSLIFNWELLADW